MDQNGWCIVENQIKIHDLGGTSILGNSEFPQNNFKLIYSGISYVSIFFGVNVNCRIFLNDFLCTVVVVRFNLGT